MVLTTYWRQTAETADDDVMMAKELDLKIVIFVILTVLTVCRNNYRGTRHVTREKGMP